MGSSQSSEIGKFEWSFDELLLLNCDLNCENHGRCYRRESKKSKINHN